MNDKRVKGPARNGQQAKTKLARGSRKRDGQAAADDRRLDAELADSFPASDPPSILRRGNPSRYAARRSWEIVQQQRSDGGISQYRFAIAILGSLHNTRLTE